MHKTYVIRKYCSPKIKGSFEKLDILPDEAQKVSPKLEDSVLPEASPIRTPENKTDTADVINKKTVKLENGDSYDGEIRENKFNGKGTYV